MGISDFLNSAKESLRGVPSKLGTGFDAAREYVSNLRSASAAPGVTPVEPGAGAATTEALGDASVKTGRLADYSSAQISEARAASQAATGAKAQLEMAQRASPEYKAFIGESPIRAPSPEFVPPSQAVNGVNPPGRSFTKAAMDAERLGIGNDAVRGAGGVKPQTGVFANLPGKASALKTNIASIGDRISTGASALKDEVASGLKGAGFLKKAAVRLGQVGGAVTAGYGVKQGYDAIKTGSGETAGNAVDNIVSGGLMTVPHPAVQLLGAGYQGLAALRDAGLNAMWKSTYGEDYTPPGQKPAVTPPAAIKEVAAPAPPKPVLRGNNVRLTDGRVVPAEEVISGSGAPAPGTGAIKRTTPGNEGEATAVGRPDELRNKGAKPERYVPQTDLGGLAGATVALHGERADRAYEAKKAAAGVARRAADDTHNTSVQAQETKTEELHKQRVMDQIGAEAPTTESGTLGIGTKSIDPKVREESVKQRHQQVWDRIKQTVADRKDGKTVGQMKGAEVDQLLLANKVMEKTIKGRDTFSQSVHDFFGAKRVDSKNLYDAMPARGKDGKVKPAERSGMAGNTYRITMGNGNTATVVMLAGGAFNALSPNEPVDADVMKLIQPAIDERVRLDKQGQK